MKATKSSNDRKSLLTQRLPDGRALADVRHLASVLVSLDVPGASHEKGREENAEAYAAHLSNIFNQAGNIGVEMWMRDMQAKQQARSA